MFAWLHLVIIAEAMRKGHQRYDSSEFNLVNPLVGQLDYLDIDRSSPVYCT